MALPYPDFIQVIAGLEKADPRRGILLVDRKFRESTYSYQDLHRRILFLAGSFRSQGIHPGHKVLISLTATVDQICSFLALMYIGAIPVSVAPPLLSQNRETHLDRLARLFPLLDLNGVLATEGLDELSNGARTLPAEVTALRPDHGAAPPNEVADTAPATVTPDDTAFIQFSSGSTSSPKGVRITHRNLLHNLEVLIRNDSRTEECVTVSWLPLCHDMGLVGCLLSNLLLKNNLVLMDPLCFMLRPVSWLAAISKARGTTTAIPNFALDICIDRVSDEQLVEHSVDLSRFRYVYCGSEPINPRAIERFEKKFAKYGFAPGGIRPVYGMSETTLVITAPDPDPARSLITRSVDGRKLVSVGRPLDDFQLKIDDGTGAEARSGQIGEVWVQGTSVTPGYVGENELSDNLFHDGWLKTGDLGLVDEEGYLYITGRKKDLIIHQGRNFYGHDITASIEELPSISKGKVYVFGTVTDHEEKVVVITTLPANMEPDRLKEDIRKHVLASFGLPVDDIVIVKRVPKTTSGKINRGLCEQMYRETRQESTGTEL